MSKPDRACPDYPNECVHPWAHARTYDEVKAVTFRDELAAAGLDTGSRDIPGHDHRTGFPTFAPDATLIVRVPQGTEQWPGVEWNAHVTAAAKAGNGVLERLVSCPPYVCTTTCPARDASPDGVCPDPWHEQPTEPTEACPACGDPAPGPDRSAAPRPAGYEVVVRALHRDGLGALRTGDVVASAVSTRPTLVEAVEELLRAVGGGQRG